MQNKDIRQAIKSARLRNWQIAEGLGIREETLSRKLRRELPEEEKQCIRQIILELSEGAA